MATMITEDCINCGACEPECPNTAIYQGGVEWEFNGAQHPAIDDDIFYIVPDKCTECVGFFDQEACAAVCPVDCCLPNPDIVETEEALLARAKELHPEQTFGDDFPSRFKGEGGEAAPAEAAVAPEAASAPAPQPAPAAAPAPAAPPPPAAAPVPVADSVSLSIPSVDEWEVPMNCQRCDGEFSAPFRHFRIGIVFYCTHCGGSLVVNSSMFKDVATALDSFHAQWVSDFEAFQAKRQRELEAFEKRKQVDLENFSTTLKQVVSKAKPAGRTHRRLSLFGFQRVG